MGIAFTMGNNDGHFRPDHILKKMEGLSNTSAMTKRPSKRFERLGKKQARRERQV